ncbi:hypothetical protein ABXS75_00985 [Roseburia hominis]
MLETIVDRQVVFYFVGAAIAIGIIAKLTAGISLKRLVKAASNMSKSNHSLMRLVRAKFEHACMVSDRVQNVGAFVDKYVYEYRVLGLRLHSLKRLERAAIWLCALFAAVGAGLAYYEDGLGRNVYQYGIVGGAGVLVLFIVHNLTDEQYQIQAARMYMVDFLENTYAHRYEKNQQKGFQVTVQRAPSDAAEERPGEVVYANAGVSEAAYADRQRQEVPYGDPRPQEVPPMNDPMVQPEKNMPVREPSPQRAPLPPTSPQRHPTDGGVVLRMEDGEDLPPENYGYARTRGDMPSGAGAVPQRNANARRMENGYFQNQGEDVYRADSYGERNMQYRSAEANSQDIREERNRSSEGRKDRGGRRKAGDVLRQKGQAAVQAQPVSSGYVQAAGGYGQDGAGMENGRFYGQAPGGAEEAVRAEHDRQDVPKEARIREILEEFLT